MQSPSIATASVCRTACGESIAEAAEWACVYRLSTFVSPIVDCVKPLAASCHNKKFRAKAFKDAIAALFMFRSTSRL